MNCNPMVGYESTIIIRLLLPVEVAIRRIFCRFSSLALLLWDFKFYAIPIGVSAIALSNQVHFLFTNS